MTRRAAAPRALLMADLGFGDSGKGLVSDYLCRHEGVDLIIRYCGGPNAGHNVVTSDGKHVTFVQVGAGGLQPDVRTLLSRFMLVNPVYL
jgi:adenylosuccinate synthase